MHADNTFLCICNFKLPENEIAIICICLQRLYSDCFPVNTNAVFASSMNIFEDDLRACFL